MVGNGSFTESNNVVHELAKQRIVNDAAVSVGLLAISFRLWGCARLFYTAVILLVADTVRNIPPLAFSIPMNITVKYEFMIVGLLAYRDYHQRVLSLPRDSR